MNDQETSAKAAAESILPGWVYWAVVAAALTSTVLPAKISGLLLLGGFYALFAYFLVNTPERTLPLFVLCMPVFYMLPRGFSLVPGLNFETFVVLGLTLAVAISQSRQPPSSPHRNPFLAPAVFYAALLIFSGMLSHAKGAAQGHSYQQGWFELSGKAIFSNMKNVLFFVFLAPLTFRLIWTKDQLRQLVTIVIGVTAVLCVHAFWETRSVFAGGTYVGGWVRAGGLHTKEANLFGGFLAMMLAIALALLLGAKLTKFERILTMVCLGFGTPALLLTFSRGSWLAMLVALMFLAVFRGAKAMAFVLAIALTGTFWIPEAVLDRIGGTVRKQDSAFAEAKLDHSTSSRLERWEELPSQWIQAPILGHGFGSYGKVWGRIGRAGEARGAHSSVITLLVEEGLLGLIAYMWLMWLLISRGWYLSRYGEDDFVQSLGAGFVAAILALGILDLTGSRFLSPPTMVYIWILGGALARFVAISHEERRTSAVRGARAPLRHRHST